MLSKVFRRVAPMAHLIKPKQCAIITVPLRHYRDRDDDDFYGGGQDEFEKAENFTKNYSGIKQALEADLPMTEMAQLPEDMQRRLRANGIEDLFPVQKSAYNLFVRGKELIVK